MSSLSFRTLVPLSDLVANYPELDGCLAEKSLGRIDLIFIRIDDVATLTALAAENIGDGITCLYLPMMKEDVDKCGKLLVRAEGTVGISEVLHLPLEIAAGIRLQGVISNRVDDESPTDEEEFKFDENTALSGLDTLKLPAEVDVDFSNLFLMLPDYLLIESEYLDHVSRIEDLTGEKFDDEKLCLEFALYDAAREIKAAVKTTWMNRYKHGELPAAGHAKVNANSLAQHIADRLGHQKFGAPSTVRRKIKDFGLEDVVAYLTNDFNETVRRARKKVKAIVK